MLTLLGTKLYEKVTLVEEEVFSIRDYHDISNIVPLNDILSFCINEEDKDIIFTPLNEESVFLIGLNFKYRLKRVIVHNDDRVQERIYAEIVNTKTDEKISLDVAIPKELEKETLKYHIVIIREGSHVLLDYKEYDLKNYKIMVEHDLPGFDTIHDFVDRVGNIYVDKRINL